MQLAERARIHYNYVSLIELGKRNATLEVAARIAAAFNMRLSDLVRESEVLVKNLANNSHTLTRNRKVGGHPDLIPRGKYPNDEVLRSDEGIEVKTSRQSGGWQGHNPEDAWILVFRYIEDEREGITPLERKPLEFVQVLCAYIKREEWSSSGRSSTSRRTITASITEAGMDKLRSNPVYQNPDYIVAPNRTLREKYRQIQQDFQQR